MKEFICSSLKFITEENSQVDVKFLGNNDDIWEFSVGFSANEPIVPQKTSLKFSIPLVGIHNVWTPEVLYNHGLTTNWLPFISGISVLAPVQALVRADGNNRLCISYSDAINFVRFKGKVKEETCSWEGEIILFDGISDKIKDYNHVLRFDMRDIPMGEAVKNVASWWETFPLLKPMDTVEKSKYPMYSTWYSMHQQVTTDTMLEQSRIASEYGCKAIIIDDGWQTEDGSRGYAYCGDWEVCESKIPDMAKLVEEMHKIDTAVLIWYCVPLIGYKSRKWEELKGMLLTDDYNNQGCGVLDPRYKVVRDYIIKTYIDAVTNWNLDGLKLDFIDQFIMYEDTEKSQLEGMDFVSVSEATYCLMLELSQKLKDLNPNIMIEFRQRYAGPTMRAYGNIFRATDCPSDPFINRKRILDLRLTSGNTVVHADMIRWNDLDTDESVAYHLWSTIFSVAQISVDLTTLSDSHKKVLKNFTDFSVANIDLLIDGDFNGYVAQTAYTTAKTEIANKACIAVYEDKFVKAIAKDEFYLVNASYNKDIFVDITDLGDAYECKVYDAYGELILTDSTSNYTDIMKLALGVGFRAEFKKI